MMLELKSSSVNLAMVFLVCFFFHANVNATPIKVVDDTQRMVVLEQPAKRVIALAPHIVENIFTVGGGDKIVGVIASSDFPETAKTRPVIGSHSSLNLEQIISLKPDLIMAWRSGGSARALEKLLKLGYPIYFGEPKSVEHIAHQLQDFGLMLGLEKPAAEAAQIFLKHMSELREVYGAKKKVKVFYQIWNDPLQTVSGDQLISDVIELCGGVNIFHDAPSIAPLVSREAVIGLDPDVIATGERVSDRPAGYTGPPSALKMWEKYTMISAVKNNQFVGINPDWMHRHTVRIYDGAKVLCSGLDRARKLM